MNFRYYIITLLLVAAGLTVGVLMKPTRTEIALMNLEDKNFQNALRKYKALIDAGDRSANVIIPLAELYIEYGRVENAIQIIEGFVEDNPHSVYALHKLARLYKDAQKTPEYIATLEKIHKKHPSAGSFRKLAYFYETGGNYEKLKELLEQLMLFPGQSASEYNYVKLSYLYAREENYSDAISAMEYLMNRQNGRISPQSAGLLVGLLLDDRQKEKALRIARNYIDNNPVKAIERSNNIILLTTLISQKGHPGLALKFIGRFEEEVKTNTALFAEFINLQIANGLNDEAYAGLGEYSLTSSLPVRLQDTYIDLAIARKDMEVIRDITDNIALHNMSEYTVILLTEFAIRQNLPEIAHSTADNLGEEFLQKYPVLADFLEYAEKRDITVLDGIEGDKLSFDYRRILLGVYLRTGQQDKSDEIIASMPVVRAIEFAPIEDVVRVYATAGMGEKAMVDLADYTTRDKDAHYTWLLMASAIGKEESVKEWISGLPEDFADYELLSDIYYTASEYKHFDIAAQAAAMLYEKSAKPENRILLAEALINNGQSEEALGHLRELSGINPEMEDQFITAIARLAKDGHDIEDYKQDLLDIATHKLNEEDFDIIELGDYGYQLLELGLEQTARNIFFKLAQEADFDNEYVEQFLEMWEKKPAPEHIKWIKQRILQAENKGKWLNILEGKKEFKLIAGLVEDNPDWLKGSSILDSNPDSPAAIYFNALAELKDKQKYAAAIKDELEREKNPERRNKIILLAFDEDAFAGEDEEKFLTELASLMPEAGFVHKKLGNLAFEKGRYRDAGQRFENYLKNNKGDYRTHYSYGLVLYRGGNVGEANRHFTVALKQIDKIKNPDFDAELAKAHLLFKKRQVNESLTLFKQLLSKYPRSKELRADYANVLIQIGEFSAAEGLLERN